MIRYICDNKTDEFMATAAGNMADVQGPVDGYKLVHVWREEAHDDDV